MRLTLSLCFLIVAYVLNFAPIGFVSMPAQAASTIRLDASAYVTSEASGRIHITVTRNGDTANPATVDYATSNGTASERTDFTSALGTLRFAAGETTKTFTILITDNNISETDETIELMLFNPTGGAAIATPDAAVVTIDDDDLTPAEGNPVDDSRYFVRQHYHDFFAREPDQAGLDFWTDQVESCGPDPQCREVKRINVSAAFFLSIEFHEIGYFVRRLYSFYQARFWPIWREFMRDVQELGRGVVVGSPGWQERLEANKRAFIEDWYVRHRAVLYSQLGSGTLTDEQYVDALFWRIQITPAANERRALVDGLMTGSETRASVLRKVAENSEFVNREFRRAFVMMQYFGYLRREPDGAGFQFWLNKLDQFNGNFVHAEMVKAFITSNEYRQRFTVSDALPEAFFEFHVAPRPETVIFKLNDPARIAQARSLVGQSKIVVGLVVKERVYYNRGWRFHLEPASIGFADITIEVCDTGIAAVENGLEHVGGAFLPGNIMCPWNSRVLREVPRPTR